ncbi:hypothetical protein C8Q74DRAFT_1261031 [Fomes fomentarius]|nr:hypothetical protein C8Q74DRAFT_1261031 [Fomes fomentarius]
MPATRATTRHGSRQPQPYPQDNVAGPSHPNAIVIMEAGPPHRRQPVDRKASKQRVKPKPRAPLPPPAEIIEISSDEDEPPLRKVTGSHLAYEKRIRELEEENKKLTAAAAAGKAMPPVWPVPIAQGATADKAFKDFLSTMDEHVTCEICQLKMWHPFTLACGHTYCKNCLQDWFNSTYVKHLAAHPNYDAQKLIPAQWRASLARPDLPRHTRLHLEREIARILSTTPQPNYNCPTCRVLVKAKPAENFVVKHLVRSLAGVQGESSPKDDHVARIPGRPVEGPFDAFFPETGL